MVQLLRSAWRKMELEVPVIPRISLRYPETGLDIPVSADSAPSSTHLLRYTRPLVSLLLLSHLPMQYGFAVGVMRRHRTQTAAPMCPSLIMPLVPGLDPPCTNHPSPSPHTSLHSIALVLYDQVILLTDCRNLVYASTLKPSR